MTKLKAISCTEDSKVEKSCLRESNLCISLVSFSSNLTLKQNVLLLQNISRNRNEKYIIFLWLNSLHVQLTKSPRHLKFLLASRLKRAERLRANSKFKFLSPQLSSQFASSRATDFRFIVVDSSRQTTCRCKKLQIAIRGFHYILELTS